MLSCNGFKCLVTDSAASAAIRWPSGPQRDLGRSLLNIRHFHILLELAIIHCSQRTPYSHALNAGMTDALFVVSRTPKPLHVKLSWLSRILSVYSMTEPYL